MTVIYLEAARGQMRCPQGTWEDAPAGPVLACPAPEVPAAAETKVDDQILVATTSGVVLPWQDWSMMVLPAYRTLANFDDAGVLEAAEHRHGVGLQVTKDAVQTSPAASPSVSTMPAYRR